MIGIVTVLYNSSKVLVDFFQSLEEQTFKEFVLYIVDNNSPDNSLEVAKELASRVVFKSVILPQEENWGVAKGNNIGIKRALEDGCDYVILSNNDVVLEKDCIGLLLEGLNSQNASLAVPKIYFFGTEKIIWSAGGRFETPRCINPHRGYREKDEGQYDSICRVDYSPTCFMLIRKEVFQRVGFMDENYFVYYDDADFIWRAVRKGLEDLVYVPNSVMWHKESYSTGGSKSDFYIHFYNRNKIYFVRKNFSFFQRIVFGVYIVVQYIIRSHSIYNKDQRKLYIKSCLEGWKYYEEKNNELIKS